MRPYIQIVVFIAFVLPACKSQRKDSNASAKPIQQYVIIRKVVRNNDSIALSADYVQYLRGDSANEAARKSGEAESYKTSDGITHYTALNDYFIVNENLRIRNLKLDPSCAYDLLLWLDRADSRITENSLASFEKIYQDNLFRLTISGNNIIKIEEVFIP